MAVVSLNEVKEVENFYIVENWTAFSERGFLSRNLS